ncbi:MULTISPECIES: hypothetical protein [unclassified Streptomyces]|uniref:hypothetical protein n=1 Tax=Streptomyces sp. NPDC046988 TaxID=3154922 RepID=UPI0033D67F4A
MQPTYVPASAPPARSRWPLAAAALVGLLIGAGGVGAAWALTGDEAVGGDGARGDARGACDALTAMDESKLATRGKAGEQALYRFAAAFDLSTAAAAGDSSYEPLAKAVSGAHQRHRQVFEVDAGVKAKLSEARGICADL